MQPKIIGRARSMRGTRAPRARRIGREGIERLEARTLLTSASFAVTSDWGSGFGGQITIDNTGPAAVSNWSLSFTWDRSITSIWDGVIASHAGNAYTINNAGYNATIPAGGSVSFGFNGAAGNVGTDVPTGYQLDGAAIGSGSGSAPTLSIDNIAVNDGPLGATAVFDVSLSPPSSSPVSVGYSTVDGTARAGTNYTAESGTLTIAPGAVGGTISVPILPDTVSGPSLNFQVDLANADGAGLAGTSGTATIVDTVPPPTNLAASASFAVTSDWGSGFGGQITIANNQSTPIDNWTLGFTWDRSITSIWDGVIASHAGNAYTINNAGYNATIPANGSVSFGFNGSPGNVGQDVPANYVLNGHALGAPLPSLQINNVSVNDGAVGSTARFTVALSSASTKTVTVQYATADGTAHAGTDYTAASGTLAFSPGTLTQTIAVPIPADTTSKPNLTFEVVLSSPTNAGLATTTGTATIVDTITAPPVANNVSASTLEGTALALNLLADASDPSGYALSLASYTNPAHGTLATTSAGTLTYTPAAGFLGDDSFTYTVSDGHGGSATGTVTVAVVSAPTSGNWPAHVFAPYVDMTLYPTYNLTTAMQAAGLKDFTLAFITADANNAPAWGGYSSYEVNGGTFDQSIRAQVAAVRSAGGDVSVSFGGAAGTELALAITNVPALTAAYQQVIAAYGLTHIDFDIEGAAVADRASIDRRSQAIAALQASAAAAGRTLDVSFTLPVLPTGLTADGLYVLQSALKYGVKIGKVNVMAMDYGDSAAPNPQGQMGTYAIDAARSTEAQLGSLYGTVLSTAQLWEMVGVTPMIGVNDVSDEVFMPSDASQLLAFAQQVGLGELSMWSLARDREDPRGALSYSEDNASSIVQAPFAFSDIFNAFTS